LTHLTDEPFSSFRADVDDVNNMNESPDIIEQALQSSMRRRDFLTKAAAAGAITWVTPVILSRAAHADVIGGGTANCRPEFHLECVVFECPGQSSMAFPGIKVVGTGMGGALECPCQSRCSGPPQGCIRITNLSNCGSGANLQAYPGGLTSCKSGTPKPSQSTGCWTTLDASQGFFFGPPPNGDPLTGNINSLGSSCCVRFRVGVWVGNCCDNTGRTAFTCKTFDVVLDWNQNTSSVICDGSTTVNCGTTGFTSTSSADSLCPTTNPQVKPCPQSPPCP
jgi:hypothetical protein